MEIRLLRESELSRSCDLVRDSFLQGTAPYYSPEGVRTFLGFSCSESLKERVSGGARVAGAFRGDHLQGVLELRPDFHISMLFVASECQGKGVGKRLLLWGLEQFRSEGDSPTRVTVNSSPNAEGFYRALGFDAREPEREVDGIRFIPMSLSLAEEPRSL